MSLRWLVHVAALSPLLLGCRGDAPRPTPAPSIGSANAATGLKATSVQLMVAGGVLQPIDASVIARWPRLETLLPPEAVSPTRWLSIALIGDAPAVEIPTPATTHPGLVAALVPGVGGTSFAMFTPEALAAHGTPTVLQAGIKEVRVVLAPVGGLPPTNGSNGGGGGGGDGDGDRVDPGNFSVTLGGKPFARDQFEALPKATAPAGDMQTQGWLLADLLRAGKLAPGPGGVRLTDATGETLDLKAADLVPSKGVGFLKLNRQGQLRFKWFLKDAVGWHGAGDLRGLSTITALP